MPARWDCTLDLWGCRPEMSASTQDYKEEIESRGRVSVRMCAENRDNTALDRYKNKS